MTAAWEARRDLEVIIESARMVICNKIGTTAAPISSCSGATSGLLTVPDSAGGNPSLTGLAELRSQLQIAGLVRKTGANGTAVLNVRFGKNGSQSDNIVHTQTIANSGDIDVPFSATINVASSGSYSTTISGSAQSAGVSGFVTRSTQFDTAVKNYVTADVSSAHASDLFKLLLLRVEHIKD